MTNNPFSATLKKVRDARAPKPETVTEFEAVLDNFARALEEAGIYARWSPTVSGRRRLSVAPKYQPGRASSMLSVAFDHEGAEVFVNPPRRAKSADELTQILNDFLSLPAFQETIDELLEQAKSPVEGFLRQRPMTISRGDVMFEIPPAMQESLANAAESGSGQQVSLIVNISTFVGAGTLVEGAKYVRLESAGYTLGTNEKPVDAAPVGEGMYTLSGIPGRIEAPEGR